MSKLAEIKKNTIFANSVFESKAIGHEGGVIFATHTEIAGDGKACGIFSISGKPIILIG